jgi:hypothetical protein
MANNLDFIADRGAGDESPPDATPGPPDEDAVFKERLRNMGKSELVV